MAGQRASRNFDQRYRRYFIELVVKEEETGVVESLPHRDTLAAQGGQMQEHKSASLNRARWHEVFLHVEGRERRHASRQFARCNSPRSH